MPTVDFVYDQDCPNVKVARANLMRAFSRTGLSARWKEHQIGSAEAPTRVRGFGSPTILVDGVDVGGLTAGAEDCCRSGDLFGLSDLVAENDRELARRIGHLLVGRGPPNCDEHRRAVQGALVR